jgi:hypothetical protein
LNRVESGAAPSILLEHSNPRAALVESGRRDVTLIESTKKPFDVLAEGLSSEKNRGDRRWTFPNDLTRGTLLWAGLTQRIDFQSDTFFELSCQNG